MSSSQTIRKALKEDLPRISKLHARVFGPGRFTKSAYRVREGAKSSTTFDHVGLQNDQLIAALNFTKINIGEKNGALLLGPFVVDPDEGNKGLGTKLMEHALQCVQQTDVKLVLLVGDHSYYKRFGFEPVPLGQITFPGPVDPSRILAVEFAQGALDQYEGRISASA